MHKKSRNLKIMKKSLFSSFPLFPSVKRRFSAGFAGSRSHGLTVLLATTLCSLGTGCQVLSYSSPIGERFTRSSFGAVTAISSLTVESGTNGLRRVHLHGYQNDSTQALGVITDAAVRAAVQAVKP